MEGVSIKIAIEKLEEMGYDPIVVSDTEINITHFLGTNIKYWPENGWHSGKNIEDGRGLEHLLNQL